MQTQDLATQGYSALTYQDYAAPGFLQFSDFTQPSQQAAIDAWNDMPTTRPLDQQQHQQQQQGLRGGGVAAATKAMNQLSFEDGFDEEGLGPSQPLPEFACTYCGVANPACVAKCLSTGKWFCNGRIHKAGSCMVVHLVKSKCKEIQLHKDSPLGDAVLECYASGTRNVFVLGFVPVRSESTVVLLARDTPVNHPTIKDLNLDLTQWQPIVEERALVNWLVKNPTERDIARARPITLAQATALEEAWRSRPTATLDDLDAPQVEGEEEEVTPVALRYTDVHQYHSVFKPLVKLEADYDRSMKEGQSRDNITVRWDWALNHKRLAYFFFPKDDNDLRLVPGDELKLRHRNASARGPWEGNGVVIRFDQTEEVCLELSSNDCPDDCTVGFHVDFVWKATSFDRMKSALHVLDKDRTSISGYLYHTLLGHQVEPTPLRIHPPRKGFSVPTLPDLNHSQLAALKSVLTAPLSLIQGPPGTGKTVTSAAIVYHIVQASKRTDEPCVLVAAPSNVAVDQLADKISQTGLKVVRLCAKSREDVLSPCEHLTLHYQVRHVDLPGAEMYKKLLQLREDQGGLRAEDEKQLFSLRRRLEMEILEAADVVCVTCVGAGDARLKGFRFQHVLIDEATQAAEPECLIPLVMGAKQVILVGDHCQLGPVIMCKKAAEAGLSQSLFERLRLLGIKPIRLQVQYRMHPCLSEFPSNMFYEGTLQNGSGVGDRLMRGVDFPWPNPDKPMMFYVQLGAEEISASGTSFLNRTEATNVEKIVTRFLQNGVNPNQIGVITPYEGQRAHVVSVMTRNGTMRQDLYRDIEVSSVDAFQGREKDVIVLSCVRSNEQQSIGFLGDPRRLNVALTRARFGLVILGNPRVLSKQPLWNTLLTHFKEQGCLVEGPLNNLKASMIQLGRPRKTFDRASFGVGVLTTNRYQPPENVGDAMPAKVALQDTAAAPNPTGMATAQPFALPTAGTRGGALAGKHDMGRAGRSGPGGSAGGVGPRGGPSAQGPGTPAFMPFAMPTYAIPNIDARPSRGADLGMQSQGAVPITQAGMMSARTQASQMGFTLPATLASQTGATQQAYGAAAAGTFTGDGFSQYSAYGQGMLTGYGAPAADNSISLLDDYGALAAGSQYDALLLSQVGAGDDSQFLDPATGTAFS